MTANDVAATFNRLADPANKSNALSAFGGVLTPGSATAPDDATVVFTLDAPNGGVPLPRLVGQLQRDHPPRELRPGGLGQHVHRHRARSRRVSYTPKVGASLVAQRRATGAAERRSTRVEVTFYEDEQAARPRALRAGRSTRIDQFGVAGGQAILADTDSFTVIDAAGALRTGSSRCATT